MTPGPIDLHRREMDVSWSIISAALKSYSRVTFDPMWGNHGDTLIKLGALKFLSANRKTVSSSSAGDVLVLSGGGAMARGWGGIDRLMRHIRDGAREVIVLPSSFDRDDSLLSLRKLVKETCTSLTLFARDQRSLAILEEIFESNVRVALGHDMAFYLRPEDLGIRPSTPRRRYSLFVERRDAERSTGIQAASAWRIPLKTIFPQSLKRPIKRLLTSHKPTDSQFVRDCIYISESRNININHIVYADVSDKTIFSFRYFLHSISQADYVFTTRLHVAILRELVGRPCFLYPTMNGYSKNQDVFDHSLKRSGNVELITARLASASS